MRSVCIIKKKKKRKTSFTVALIGHISLITLTSEEYKSKTRYDESDVYVDR